MPLLLLLGQFPPTGIGASTQAPQFVTATGVVTGTTQGGGGGGTATAPTMRVYGRVNQVNGQGGTWVVVTTDSNGYNDMVYLTALVQALKLNLGESPFWANIGIPAQQSVITQVFPDYYASVIQQYFAPFFASLSIVRKTGSNPPVYKCNAVCHSGAVLRTTVAT